MDFFKDIFDKLSDIFSFSGRYELTEFQKRKLLHEFHMFYDVNKDGTLEWKDLELARETICKLSGWKAGSKKYTQVQELFIELWRSLQDCADENFDGRITQEEWVTMWKNIRKTVIEAQRACKNEEELGTVTEQSMPPWFNRYVQYKFNLYDRAGDAVIDIEEFEYVLSSKYNIPNKECRAAFTVLSKGGEKKVDFEYFRELALQYYLYDDQGALGNFINGKLSYD